jgi:hypothetical protein
MVTDPPDIRQRRRPHVEGERQDANDWASRRRRTVQPGIDPLETVNLTGTVEAAAQIPALAQQLEAMTKRGTP